jgi:diaminohydroxyphosphoribosylaminopyrimidine deaminase/5-amino-6-(5-phosphoribosylamino)uracil reductase
MVGANTVRVDDPLLTARPSGARVATRIVMDSTASLKSKSQLCQTAREFPTLVATGPAAPVSDVKRLRDIGCEVWVSSTADPNQRLMELLQVLAERNFTNVLVEGGGGLLGSLNDLGQIDEIHAFIGPRLIGGSKASSPISGKGQAVMTNADWVQIQSVQQLEQDIYLIGRKVC